MLSLCCILLGGTAAWAQLQNTTDSPEAAVPRIPLAAVEKGGVLTSELMDAVQTGTASPSARGEAIQQQLKIAVLPDNFDPADLEERFQTGETSFFDGRLDTAEQAFAGIADYLQINGEIPAFYPNFRKIRFKSNLYLAVIAHGKGDIALFEHRLTEAAEISEMTPSPAEFPPWVCSAFDNARQAIGTRPTGSITLLGHTGCLLTLNGQVWGEGPVVKNVPVGNNFIRIRCGEKNGPVQQVQIRKNQSLKLYPLMIHNTLFDYRAQDAFLTSTTAVSDDAVIRDLLELGAALQTDRIIAVIARSDSAEVVLLDVGLRRPVRSAVVTGELTASAMEAATRKLTSFSPQNISNSVTLKPVAPRRPWYKDWAAWTVVLTGAAALGAGIAVERKYDLESRQAPLAVSLMATGAGLIAGGGILFFVQPVDTGRRQQTSKSTVGVSLGGTF